MSRIPFSLFLLSLAVTLLAGCGSYASAPTLNTPEEAWRALEGSWSYRVDGGNSTTTSRLQFTPDRKMLLSTSLVGGVLPGAMTSDHSKDITAVAVESGNILLTLGPGGKPAGPMTVYFAGRNQIRLEDGPTYTRD